MQITISKNEHGVSVAEVQVDGRPTITITPAPDSVHEMDGHSQWYAARPSSRG